MGRNSKHHPLRRTLLNNSAPNRSAIAEMVLAKGRVYLTSLSSPKGGEGRGEEALSFPTVGFLPRRSNAKSGRVSDFGFNQS